MLNRISLAAVFSCFLLFSVSEAKTFHYHTDFSKAPARIGLKNGAVVKDGKLNLPKSRSYAEVHGSEEFSFASGGTVMAVCKFNDLSLNPEKHRFFLNKNGSFLFALTNGKYNFSLFHDQRWSIALIGGTPPKEGEWVHLAAVARRIDEKEQSQVGFYLEIYVNGERILRRFVSCEKLLDQRGGPITIGISDRRHNFCGEVGEVTFIQRSLSTNEIAEAAAKSKLVKMIPAGCYEVSGGLDAQLKRLAAAADTPVERFIASSLYKSAATGTDMQKVARGIAAAGKVFAENTGSEKMLREFNRIQKDFMLLSGGKDLLFLICGNAGRAFPVVDIYDTEAQCGIFGNRSNTWSIRYKMQNGRQYDICDYSDDVKVTCGPVEQKNGKYIFPVTWKHPKIEVSSQASFGADGLRMDLKAKSLSPEYLLTETVFPQWKFARKKGKDFLVSPFMSGVLIPDPIETYSYEREFPCAQVSMQFQGYYGESGDGVYVAMEDPYGTSRHSGVSGIQGQLLVHWKTPCPYLPGQKGGNSFDLGAETVVRTYRGGWFECGQLYKKFLSERASWWIPELPRRSTPEWFRNNSIWILAGVFPSRNEATLHYLRRYFEMPFGVHLVSASGRRLWPHFDIRTDVGERLTKSLQSAGIRIVPYSDPRLWGEINPDGTKGWSQFASGLAVKKENGEPFVENYGMACLVLCPAARAWQDKYLQICTGMAEQGFDGIYHDQLPCSHSVYCFDPAHKHAFNDPSVWVRYGYAEMYRRLHAVLKPKYPELVHTGEDASDPYMKMVDGYTCWRWTTPNAIPLFQSIYAGRIQFTGKLYNHQKPGDWESNFAKAASQVVNAEQLGWITLEDLEAATPFRKYFKTLAWIRYALLEYFNTADRLAPLDFTRSPGTMVSVWGHSTTDGVKVESDIILHSVWKLPDGRIMALFLNTADQPQEAEVKWPYKGNFLYVCRPDSGKPERVTSIPAIKLSPYSMEVWLLSPQDNSVEAVRIASVLQKTTSFDEGKTLQLRSKVRQKIPTEQKILPGKLLSVTVAEHYTNAFRRYFANGTDKDTVLIFYQGSEICYSGLTFEKSCSEVRLVAAYDPSENGGRFEIWSNNKKIGETVLAKGGRYLAFQEIPVVLNQNLMGKGQTICIRFYGKSVRFKGLKTF